MTHLRGNGQLGSARRGSGGMPAVLMYHSVSPYDEDPYRVTVSPDRFGQQMSWLCRRGLTGVSVGTLLEARRHGNGRHLVGLTFDDGYADFTLYVLPVLASYGFTASVFVIAGLLGGDNEWDPSGPRKPLLRADQIRQVADAGMEIGSHGLRHVSLARVAGPELTAETAVSRDILRRVSGQDVSGFCYPYGSVDRHAVDSVKASGYDYACAIWPSVHTGRYALPRSYIGEADSPARLWAKGLRHWLTWSDHGPRWGSRVVDTRQVGGTPHRAAVRGAAK
jgi:peptidoglycan/xylan/chitin deacetylase (PgdA/CDA1 family)